MSPPIKLSLYIKEFSLSDTICCGDNRMARRNKKVVLKIPKGYAQAVNRRTDETMANKK